MAIKSSRLVAPIGHGLFILAFLVVWEIAAQAGYLDRTFFGRPSGILLYLWRGLFVVGNLWLELGYTLLGASISFIGGSATAVLLGLLFTSLPTPPV